MEHLAVGMQIVEYIREHFHKELNEKLVLGLSDHISFAIERQKQGLSLANTLLLEIKKFYTDEYRLGQAALDIIEEQLGVRLPEDEAAVMAAGMTLQDGTRVLPGKLKVLEGGENPRILLTIQEGKFHQVKRMFEALACQVVYLKRISMGPVVLDESLKPGEYRRLTGEEIRLLGGETDE